MYQHFRTQLQMRHNLCKLCNEPSKETVSISLLTKAKYVQNVQSRRVILVRVKLYAYNELALSDICNNRCLSRLGCAVPNYISVRKNSLNPAGAPDIFVCHICVSGQQGHVTLCWRLDQNKQPLTTLQLLPFAINQICTFHLQFSRHSRRGIPVSFKSASYKKLLRKYSQRFG